MKTETYSLKIKSTVKQIWYISLCHCRSDRSCNKCAHAHTYTHRIFIYAEFQERKKERKKERERGGEKKRTMTNIITISIPFKTEENLMNITFSTCKQNLQPVGI